MTPFRAFNSLAARAAELFFLFVFVSFLFFSYHFAAFTFHNLRHTKIRRNRNRDFCIVVFHPHFCCVCLYLASLYLACLMLIVWQYRSVGRDCFKERVSTLRRARLVRIHLEHGNHSKHHKCK